MTLTSYQVSGYDYFTKSKILEIAQELRDNPGLRIKPYLSTKISELRAALVKK
jgi:hypothetical protein